MGMTNYFIDTNELIRAITESDPFSVRLFKDTTKKKIINDYVLKETRRVLSEDFLYSHYDIDLAMEKISAKFRVVSNPPKNRFKKLNKIRDKSDRPIVQSAIDHECILITRDRRTYQDAKIYLETKTAKEIYE